MTALFFHSLFVVVLSAGISIKWVITYTDCRSSSHDGFDWMTVFAHAPLRFPSTNRLAGP